MRDDYKITGETGKVEYQLDLKVSTTIEAMSKHTKLTPSEIANTALKRFISQHKDFLPNPTSDKK